MPQTLVWLGFAKSFRAVSTGGQAEPTGSAHDDQAEVAESAELRLPHVSSLGGTAEEPALSLPEGGRLHFIGFETRFRPR